MNSGIYDKQDAVMTRGFAILCMVVLHLFCRTGADVYGTPLLWINRETPVVYWFGFYAEICVSIYAICMGYAQYLLYINEKTTVRSTWKRILKLMINYWILLAMFSVIGLLYSSQKTIPGSLTDFLKSIVLLHSYNGAWWFLNTYIIFLIIPPAVKFFPIKKLSVPSGLVLCLVIQIVWYLINKAGLLPVIPEERHITAFILKEAYNLIGVLPAAWAGALFCKGSIVQSLYNQLVVKIESKRIRTIVLGCVWVLVFAGMNLIHKAVFTLIFAIMSFLIFNLWEKGINTKRVWLFLGKHSTNIWLTHMFFYATLFTGLVQTAKLPLLMLVYLLVLCIAISYIELFIENRLFAYVKNI